MDTVTSRVGSLEIVSQISFLETDEEFPWSETKGAPVVAERARAARASRKASPG